MTPCLSIAANSVSPWALMLVFWLAPFIAVPLVFIATPLVFVIDIIGTGVPVFPLIVVVLIMDQWGGVVAIDACLPDGGPPPTPSAVSR